MYTSGAVDDTALCVITHIRNPGESLLALVFNNKERKKKSQPLSSSCIQTFTPRIEKDVDIVGAVVKSESLGCVASLSGVDLQFPYADWGVHWNLDLQSFQQHQKPHQPFFFSFFFSMTFCLIKLHVRRQSSTDLHSNGVCGFAHDANVPLVTFFSEFLFVALDVEDTLRVFYNAGIRT